MKVHFFVTPETHGKQHVLKALGDHVMDSSDESTIDFEAGDVNHVDAYEHQVTIYAGGSFYITLTDDEMEIIIQDYLNE